MADHNKPVLTSTYTNFVSELDARFDDLALMLDPANTTATNVPTNSIRWNSALAKFQKYNGTSWGDLSATYNFTAGAFTTLSASDSIRGGSGATYKFALDYSVSGDVAGELSNSHVSGYGYRIKGGTASNYALLVQSQDSTAILEAKKGSVAVTGALSASGDFSVTGAAAQGYFNSDTGAFRWRTAAGVEKGAIRITGNDLKVEDASGTERLRIVNGSGVSVTGALSATGNTTLGDASTDTVTVNGYMGVGGAGQSNVAVYIQSTALTGVNQHGVVSQPTGSSAATTQINGVTAGARTAAATFTVADVASFRAQNIAKGAGSTITNNHGLVVEDLAQGTNNYGITSLVSSGANKWNIYASGTANNFFNGDLQIGTSEKALKWLSGNGIVEAPQSLFVRSTGAFPVIVQTNGSERLRIDSAGNVGIGTSSPQSKLHLSGATPASTTILQLGGDSTSTGVVLEFSGSANAFLWNKYNGYLSLGTNNTERLRIDSAGNLGLGVTPSAWGTNRKALQIGGTVAALGLAAQYSEIAHNAISTVSGPQYATSNPAAIVDFNNATAGGFAWRIAPSGTAGNAITFTQAMTLDASGNFLLGTTTYSIQPNGGITMTGGVSRINIGHNSSGANGNDFLLFSYNGSSIGAISQLGTTGISVTSPATLALSGTSVTAPTPATTDDSTKVATTAYVRDNTIGVDQTWQAVTRTSGTTYTNSTGKPIQVCASYGHPSAYVQTIATVAGVTVGTYYNITPGGAQIQSGSISFIVPAGATYSITSGGNQYAWSELR